MSTTLPTQLDAWRMVAAGRCFEARLPLAALGRLAGALEAPDGECRCELEFGRDALGVAYLEIRAATELPLLCQRTLERYLEPVRITQRLGLVNDEAQESALPPGYEALLVPEDGQIRPAELVEDELILAVPVVPMKPGTETLVVEEPIAEEEKPNPFAALAALKERKS